MFFDCLLSALTMYATSSLQLYFCYISKRYWRYPGIEEVGLAATYSTVGEQQRVEVKGGFLAVLPCDFYAGVVVNG